MKNTILVIAGALLIAAATGCNPANQKKAPEPVKVQSDTIILKAHDGYTDAASGSYVNMFNILQLSHRTSTDSSFCLIKLDSLLEATNYHLNMQLNNIKQNNGAFDVRVNCAMTLTPRADTTADSSVMFIAQCNNGKTMTFDTVRAHGQDKNFTLHIKNAEGSFYYIVLWCLYPTANSTVAMQDIMVTPAR